MAATKPWTLEELDRLPDDGNKYELVRGALLVTPAPAPAHEAVSARQPAYAEYPKWPKKRDHWR